MNVTFAFGLLLVAGAIAAGGMKYCDDLPKLTVDIRKFYAKFSGKIVKFISLNPEEVCAMAEYNATTDIKTITTQGIPDDWYQGIERPGVWRTKNLRTGAFAWDFIFAYNATDDGGFFCLYICDEYGGLTYAKRLHCDITSVDYIEQALLAYLEQYPLLRSNQTLHFCPTDYLKQFYSKWEEKNALQQNYDNIPASTKSLE